MIRQIFIALVFAAPAFGEEPPAPSAAVAQAQVAAD
jgi:hypothetical protein